MYIPAVILQLVAVMLPCAAVMAHDVALQSAIEVVPLYKEMKKACKPGCTKLGNCNFEDGRCECPYGLSGEECEIDILSACRSSPEGFPSCGRTIPKNCKCYKQCLAVYCPNFQPGDNPRRRCTHEMMYSITESPCYTLKDTSDDQQYSDIPDDLESSTKWFRAVLEAHKKSPAKLKLPVAQYGKTQNNRLMLPLSACPARCHDNGVCFTEEQFPANVNRTAVCMCKKGFMGKDCGKRENGDACFFDPSCGGHGTCLSGFCKCDEGYFGVGCARSHAWKPAVASTPGTALPVTARSRLRIYMYELPWDITFGAEYNDGRFTRDAMYTAYEYFIKSFLNDWEVRTENPLEANLFYIPMYNYFYWGNLGDPTVRIALVLKYIQDKYPYWNRTGGADHFYWLTGDRGSCHLPRDMQDQAIKVVHFGMQQHDIGWKSVRNKDYACIQVHRDVVAPPVQVLGLLKRYPQQLVEPLTADYYKSVVENKGLEERPLLLFFAGGMEAGDYSGGARQALGQVIKANAAKDVRFVEGFMHGYLQTFRTSKFCFAPYGHGWGVRIVQAMQHGCIPVIVQDFVYQPLESVLPYEDFSVRIGVKDVPQIIPILRAFTEEDIAARRLKMAEVYRAFIWPQNYGGEAYNYTLRALHQRLRHHESNMF